MEGVALLINNSEPIYPDSDNPQVLRQEREMLADEW